MAVTGGGPRVVAPPWEREKLQGARRTYVGVEDYVTPEPGPLALYLEMWPSRRVAWNRRRQLFVITDDEAPGWREFVCQMDAPPDPDTPEVPRSTEELAEMIGAGAPMTRCFLTLGYPFVKRRMRERAEFISQGSIKYAEGIANKNRAIGKRQIRSIAANQAAAMNEIKRYYPVLAGEGKKIPLVPGANFTH